jgi:hypothetical protein
VAEVDPERAEIEAIEPPTFEGLDSALLPESVLLRSQRRSHSHRPRDPRRGVGAAPAARTGRAARAIQVRDELIACGPRADLHLRGRGLMRSLELDSATDRGLSTGMAWHGAEVLPRRAAPQVDSSHENQSPQ